MRFCFWRHRLPDIIVHADVRDLERTIVFSAPNGTLLMYVGKIPCARCGKLLDAYRVAYIALGPRGDAGQWKRATRLHLEIFDDYKRRASHTRSP
ncbi:MAG: hypothetical protein KGI60_01750 [Patescibacteria group bacterium]|nr:hypothetical protein [Patescibacteria group bacterium]